MKWLTRSSIVLLLLFIITAVSYGQTLKMYFLIDDNALIYKLQHPQQNIGLWGSGIVGDGPYRHRVLQFVPFYPVFGTNPIPYFTVGVLLYFLAAVTLYFFTIQITKNKSIGFATASIFAAGYIGSETMFGITNSWETNRGIIMTLSTFMLYYRFLKTKKIIFYILSVILFFFSLDTIYVRAHGLIFAFVAFDLLFGCKNFSFREIVNSVVRLSPFFVIYYKIYLINAVGEVKRFGGLNIIQSAIHEGRFAPLTILLQDIGNLFIPDILTSRVDKIVSNYRSLPSEFSAGSLFSGSSLIVLMLFVVFKFREKVHLVKVFIFAAVFSLSNFVLFYFRGPEHTLWTTHRYFSYSFIGLALFWAVIFYLITKWLNNEKLFKILVGLVIFIYLILGVSFQRQFNERRSIPAKAFFSSFDKAVPQIPKDAYLYFDLVNDNQIRGQFGSFFGGMFSEASNLAIYSEGVDYMNDFIFTYKFDDILEALGKNKTTLDKVFTFYYGEEGLLDTTQKTRKLLLESKTLNFNSSSFSSNTSYVASDDIFKTGTFLDESGKKTAGINPSIKVSLPPETESHIPSTFSFSMSVTPKIPKLPYQSGIQGAIVDREERSRVYNYLLSQSSFRKNAVATSASFWKEQEPKFALDGRLETSWRGHRGFWDYIDRGITNDIEYLSVDLGRKLLIGQVRWISAQRPLAPTHYKILTSLDGKSWELAKEVRNEVELSEGTLVSDSFSPKSARFVKMEILKTFGNDGPELKEFEVIESEFSKLDSSIVEHVRKEPFGTVENQIQYSDALSFIKQSAILRFYFMSSADSKQDPVKYVDIPLFLDGKPHQHSIPLPATGLTWVNFTLDGFNFPAEIVIGQTKLIYQSIKN